jgi:HPt (histidine-containing phosphotransfer) domain-containing protein
MPPVLDPSFLLDFDTFDPHLAQILVPQLIELSLDHTPPLFAQLQEACDGGDMTTIHTLLHRLTGSSATIGGRHLAAHCATLQDQLRAGTQRDLPARLHLIQRAYQELTVALRQERERYIGAPLSHSRNRRGATS